MTNDAIRVIAEQLDEAMAAKKCHPCGCFHSTVDALEKSAVASALEETLSAARTTFAEKRYDCLGCDVCWPAVAANAYAEASPVDAAPLEVCATSDVRPREGWPPLPGDYTVVRYQAPVAVCTLNSEELRQSLAIARPEGLAIVGTLHTENLGIERVIRNVNANPHIRFLILCGDDTEQAIGHLPGQSLESLFHAGIDERQRIVGARGKRPVLKNVTPEQIASFLQQVELVSMIGEHDVQKLTHVIERLHAQRREPFAGGVGEQAMAAIEASEPVRMVQDPAGYFVVYPDRARRRIVVEHYTNDGVLHAIVEGTREGAIYSTTIDRGLLSRLDHSAYLGRELARAVHALESGEPYVQDRAPEQHTEPKTTSCGTGCGPPCS